MNDPVTLTEAQGRRDGVALAAVVRDLLATTPAVVWCEPRPTRRPIPGFVGLWAGDAPGLSNLLGGSLVLEEARLFWPRGSLHLLTTDRGIRWVGVWEGDEPRWLATVPADATPKRTSGAYHTHEHKVLTQRDFARYGLTRPPEFPERLVVTDYRQQGKLVFWHYRLEKNA